MVFEGDIELVIFQGFDDACCCCCSWLYDGVIAMKVNNIQFKKRTIKKILLELAPKKSLNSLSMVFIVTGGDFGGGGGCRELVAPRPHGSDRLTERLASLVWMGCWFALHGFICEVAAVEFLHGSFDTAVAEVLPVESIVHGSSMKK